MYRLPRLTAAAAIVAFGGLAACSDATGTKGMRPVSVSFSTAPATALGSGVAFAVAGADPIVITRAQLVLSKTELEVAGASCAANDVENDDDGCSEIKMGPMLVDLPLDAAARTALTVTIPAGTYHEIEAKIDAISSETEGHGQDAAAFLAAHPELRGVSIRVEGTYNGQPFVYTTGVEAELELEFTPALAVDAASNNVTLHVDVASWFRAADGSVIDPTTANAGGVNKQLVDDNIKRSIEAYEDDDRDGHRG